MSFFWYLSPSTEMSSASQYHLLSYCVQQMYYYILDINFVVVFNLICWLYMLFFFTLCPSLP